MTNSDPQLIQECLAGSADAFGLLVERHQGRLFNAMVRASGDRELATEITQEAFVLAFRKLSTFRGEAAFYSWLFRIAMNVFISEKRRRGKTSVSVDAIIEQTGHEPDDQRTDNRPDASLETDEQIQLVRAALDSLTEEFRTVLVLKEIEDLSYEEIAELVQIPIGTVRSRIHRGRAELREKLRLSMLDP